MTVSQFAHRFSLTAILLIVLVLLGLPSIFAGFGATLAGFLYGDKFWEKVFETFPDFPKF